MIFKPGWIYLISTCALSALSRAVLPQDMHVLTVVHGLAESFNMPHEHTDELQLHTREEELPDVRIIMGELSQVM